MDKILYFENLYSNRREKLIEKCCELQRQGKNFLYILPSREAIKAVRYSIIEKNKGMLNSKVIMFDELERELTEPFISSSKIIYEDIEKLLISDICSNLTESLLYYEDIKGKEGFQSEIRSFIKFVKRNCISAEELQKLIEEAEDSILKDKLTDIKLIYEKYSNSLREKGLFDINDISLQAVKAVKEREAFDKIDSIIIDGFINIDKVNLELIKAIANLNKVNLYVNCPYRNNSSVEFITREIFEPFMNMGFQCSHEDYEEIQSNSDLKELSLKFYSGEKGSRKLDNITITEYPCIEQEVRETARAIKEKIMIGEDPEEIAVCINNLEHYSEHLINIFKEFNLGLTIKQELPLSEAVVVRKAVEALKECGINAAPSEQWLQLLSDSIVEDAEETKGLIQEMFNVRPERQKFFHLKALEEVRNLIEELRYSFLLCNLKDREISREEFLKLLKEYVQNRKVTLQKGDSAGIKILNTDLAKGVYFKHVYILGINEGEIPALPKNEGLFDEVEADMLKGLGIPYKDTLWELEREKIRFNLALASATESLTLSYRAADEEGKFAIQSSFLEQVRFVANIDRYKKVTMRDRFKLSVNSVMSGEELKIVLLKGLFERKYKGLNTEGITESISSFKEYESEIFQLVNNSLVEFHRYKETDFNRYEGILEEEYKKSNFKPNIKLSPSKINSYFNCPFGFMAGNIFGVETSEEESEEYNNLEISQLYRNVLRDYYKNIKDYEKLDTATFERVFGGAVKAMRTLNTSEEEQRIRLEQFKNTLGYFLDLDLKRLQKYTKETKKVLRPMIIDEYLEGSCYSTPLGCRIDRLDMEYDSSASGLVPTGRYILYGYKKSKTASLADFLARENCQIVMNYFIAEENLKSRFPDLELDCLALLYLNVEGKKQSVDMDGFYRTEYKKALDCSRKSFDVNKELFHCLTSYIKELAEEALEKIQNGIFHYKLQCSSFEKHSHWNCPNSSLCRYNQSKMEVLTNE